MQKLGTKGYPDFRLKYAMEYKNGGLDVKSLEGESIYEKIDLDDIIDRISEVYNRSIVEPNNMENNNVIRHVVLEMKDIDCVQIYGKEMNYFIAQQVCYKLNDLGINARAYDNINLKLTQDEK